MKAPRKSLNLLPGMVVFGPSRSMPALDPSVPSRFRLRHGMKMRSLQMAMARVAAPPLGSP